MTLAPIDDPGAMRRACDALRERGERVGFVPTMGALHAGHLSLVEAVRARGAQRVVVSIFVNPLQFALDEDLDTYPRTLEQDLQACQGAGVDLVYAPTSEAIYPPGFQSHVEVGEVALGLEGKHRPSHFRGVTTVVTKLWNTVGPCIAAFGRKDYQQWRVLARLALDLNQPVEVIGCPIVREADGLAMSSRNRYLSPSERMRATALHRGLRAAHQAYRAGERDTRALEKLARTPLEAECDSIDYVALRDADSLQALPPKVDQLPCVMLMAAQVGHTRLIDNTVLSEEL